jgi:biopolymer transport protein ExbD
MALRRIRPRRRASITSLIDVIFLLLLFFMLASTFSKFSEVEITSTATGASTTSETLHHTLTISANRLLLDDIPVRLDHLAPRLNSLTANGTTPVVLVNVTPEVTTQVLIDTLIQLKRIPAIQVQLVEPT